MEFAIELYEDDDYLGKTSEIINADLFGNRCLVEKYS